ncbi:MAG TPA: HAMP domain-containing sensor histidine kinase [Polyangiales bacterium]|nr:HAMP domain-containing sensor histidine kinase [Polyangiales bacterium]
MHGASQSTSTHQPDGRHMRGMERLIEVVQELSLARELETITAIVRKAARELSGADGATFVLRDGVSCHYMDEDAIGPLWKGQRFPLEACISGWAMLHREPVIIPDIYLDRRVPADAYRPTFVKSLVIVPIRTSAPVGAIGTYWARPHAAPQEEVKLLAALADSTSIAMENVQLYKTLEERVAQRTEQLAASQAELSRKHASLLQAQRQREQMAALLVHDLKSPANGIMLSCKARLRKPELSDAERRYWRNIYSGAEIINRTASNLLDVARSEEGSLEVRSSEFELAPMLEELAEQSSPLAEYREQRLELEQEPADLRLHGDRELLRRVLQNLLDNAFHYSPNGSIVRLRARRACDHFQLSVYDQGPGIPADKRGTIFERFARLQSADHASSSGHGLGLVFCRAAVEAHGGNISVKENPAGGSVFTIRLPLG